MKLLFVDDNADDQEAIARALIGHPDFTPPLLQAHDEASCMQQLRDNPDVKCVLLDYSLPGRDGLRVLETIKHHAARLPVIVLTGNGNEQLAVHAMLAGASYYLPKDRISRESLTLTIDRSIHHAELEAKMEESRDYFEKAQRLDAVGQLAAGIAHDFNNLLSATQYAVDLLAQDGVPEAAHDRLDIIRYAINRGASLSSRLLAFSRQDDLGIRSRPVAEVFADLAQTPRTAFDTDPTITFRNHLGQGQVVCDQQQLDNSILNLIQNSADAISRSGQGGRIEVTAQPATAPHPTDQPLLEICVQDDGPGMTAQQLQKCIDPFFTTKDSKAGCGLGLTMVQAFATKSGGSLHIDSSLGEGTRILLRLPVDHSSRASAQRPPTATPHSSENGKTQILLVEDEDIQRQILTQLLQKSGFDVEAAANPQDAIEKAAKGRFNILLTDIQMPGESGFRLAERVRSLFPTIPVLYMTAYADNPEHSSEQVLGPVLQKPVNLATLIDHIHGALG